jgi:type I restriction-modification system DNA methylase subunit
MPQGQSSLHIFEDDNLDRHRIRKGAISSNGKGHSFKLDKVDVILMNPPFTRKQLIGKEYRRLLTSHFPEYAEYESKEQSLFGYFVFLADRFLRTGGRMGFVLPSTSIRQMSSRGMRRLIRDWYDLEYVILSGHRMAFSEDAAFNEILLVAKKRAPKEKPRKSFVLATIRSKTDSG